MPKHGSVVSFSLKKSSSKVTPAAAAFIPENVPEEESEDTEIKAQSSSQLQHDNRTREGQSVDLEQKQDR